MAREFRAELVAPCGMNCNICSGYLAFSRQLPKKRGKIVHCIGCRPRNKLCAFLKGRCARLREGRVEFCFECKSLPCRELGRLDERYRKKYGVSLVGNLQMIKKHGVRKFLADERKRWRCPSCGGTICIHNGKCYDCEKITSWKG
ncbi:MAG: DUF3795 domain-containing protein [Candidatus Hadarchaeota archaeon]